MSTASKDTATSVAVTAATQHAPDAATPAETTEALGVSAPLLALTKRPRSGHQGAASLHM